MNTIKNKQRWSIGLLLLVTAFFCACTKETLKDGKYYYGKVRVTLALLPGTPDVDLRFNGEKLGTVPATSATPEAFQVKANESGKLSVYQSGTDVLIADTLINLSKNQEQNYKLANSSELGIKGWISAKPVAQDSISFQLMNKLSTSNYPVAAPDLYLCTFDPITLEILSTLVVYKGFKDGVLTPVITLPLYDTAGKLISYGGRMKDPVTGKFIINKGLDIDLFPVADSDFNKGHFFIGIVKDEPDSGYINTDAVVL